MRRSARLGGGVGSPVRCIQLCTSVSTTIRLAPVVSQRSRFGSAPSSSPERAIETIWGRGRAPPRVVAGEPRASCEPDPEHRAGQRSQVGLRSRPLSRIA